MFRFVAPVAVSLAALSAPVFAQTETEAQVDRLFAALGMPEMMEIMREEGLEYGASIGTDMLPGGISAEWEAAVSSIYDVEIMAEEVRGTLVEALDGADIETMIAFFEAPTGVEIINLEVSARRALLDDAVEEASKESAALAAADNTPRFQLISEFVEVNDLIESNVVGALNSSYAFYMGLIDGGAMPAGITAETALQDVWAQEGDIRANTSEWVYSFLMLAYQPLTDDALQDYIAFSQSDAGRDLNDALFLAFNGMFDDISRALGLASSRFMISQEL